jgi:hypothetical protein
MKWIISFLIVLVHVLHRHLKMERNGNAQGKDITYRAFHFTGHWCLKKFMTGFRIDDRTIKRGKLVCISVI